MAKNLRDRIFGDSVWRTLLLAVVVLAVGQWILVWQYQRFESRRIEGLEQRIEQQQQALDERAAQDVLVAFLEARVEGAEQRAARYITEQAALQLQQGLFEFFGVQNYDIQERQNVDAGLFRFQVEITRDRLRQIELIEVLKIGDIYYVDSVQLAG